VFLNERTKIPKMSARRLPGGAAAAEKPHKPQNTLFKQQLLPAWQPVMSPPYVAGCLICVAIAFLPIGASIIIANSNVQVVEKEYSDPANCVPLKTWSYVHNGVPQTYSQGCLINLVLDITTRMPAPVYLYYKIENFYQNHRRFVRSKSDNQLAGKSVTASEVSDCSPLRSPDELRNIQGAYVNANGGGSRSYGSMIYSPCGLVAWSMFNDTFVLSNSTTLVCNTSDFSKVDNLPLNGSARLNRCTKTGITWESDSEKFLKPATFDRNLWTAPNYSTADQTANYADATDAFYRNGWYANETGHALPYVTDTDFQVWSRTASLPTFQKLFRVITTDLEVGQYNLTIESFYPVSSFSGKKSLVIQTISWVGGKNPFLGYAYIIVGALSVVFAVFFLIWYKVFPDREVKAMAHHLE
jgi:hypothetical protein